MSTPGNESRFFLLIGIFLSLILNLLTNAISLPPWTNAVALFLIIAFTALYILAEIVKAGSPVDPKERRAFFKHARLSAITVGALTILGSFFLLKDADLKGEITQLDAKKKAFDAQRQSQLTVLRIGFLPPGTDTLGQIQTNTFENSVSNLLSVPVHSLYPGKTYQDTVQALAKGEIEVGWLGPLSYLYAAKNYGAHLILCRLTEIGQKTYQSYIITRASTNIHTLQQLRGKKFALVDPLSTSGNLLPRYLLKKAGLDADTDLQSSYAGAHINVLNSVLAGHVAAGAVSSNLYHISLQQGKFHQSDLIILAKSSDLPEGPIVLRREIQLYDQLRVEDAFLTVEDIDPAIIQTIEIAGFAKITERKYEFLLDIAKELNIDIAHYD